MISPRREKLARH